MVTHYVNHMLYIIICLTINLNFTNFEIAFHPQLFLKAIILSWEIIVIVVQIVDYGGY